MLGERLSVPSLPAAAAGRFNSIGLQEKSFHLRALGCVAQVPMGLSLPGPHLPVFALPVPAQAIDLSPPQFTPPQKAPAPSPSSAPGPAQISVWCSGFLPLTSRRDPSFPKTRSCCLSFSFPSQLLPSPASLLTGVMSSPAGQCPSPP